MVKGSLRLGADNVNHFPKPRLSRRLYAHRTFRIASNLPDFFKDAHLAVESPISEGSFTQKFQCHTQSNSNPPQA